MTEKHQVAEIESSALYSEELGIDLSRNSEEEVFKWFIASQLYGGHISEQIAKRTYFVFEALGVLSVEKLLGMGHRAIVHYIMAEGHYVRYDESKTRQLLRNCRFLKTKYKGKVTNIHVFSKDANDLQSRLSEFVGFGPVTRDIFLRELKPVWEKAIGIPSLDSTFLKSKKAGIDLSKYSPGSWTRARVEAGLIRQRKRIKH